MRLILTAIVLLTAIGIAQPSFASPQAAKSAGATRAKATAANPVNLNSAAAPQLQTLPGVGPSTAQRIIDYRQKNGPFKKIEEILETSRLGPCSLMILYCASQGLSPKVAEKLSKSHHASRVVGAVVGAGFTCLVQAGRRETRAPTQTRLVYRRCRMAAG